MNQMLTGLYEPIFKTGLPWIRFSCVLGVALFTLSFEWNLLTEHKASNSKNSRSLRELEKVNEEDQIRSSAAITKAEALLQEAESVLGQLIASDADPEIGPLESAGLQDLETSRDESLVRVRLSAQKIAYHAFVPALNQQEATTPLMRCSWLSLKTTGRPFNKSALPLQVDLEVAFPRITEPPNNGQPGPRIQKAR